MEDGLLGSIDGKKRELDRYRPLHTSIANKLKEQFELEWTYNSNAIEGNTLSLHETEVVLRQGLAIGGKSVNEHLEVINHKDGIIYIESIIGKKIDIGEDVIKELHRLILKSIDDVEAGVYRRHNVRIVGAFLIPPQAIKVKTRMEELVSWYYTHKYQTPVPVLAAQFHYRFVCIHPFIDGNGRVARLLMNLILMAQGYPPAVILKVDRQKYYRVLNDANQGKEENFENFVGRSIERSLIIYLNSTKPNVSEKEGLINLKEASRYCNYSQEYLSLLARKGKLSAVKIHKEWVTTREAIEEYIRLHGEDMKTTLEHNEKMANMTFASVYPHYITKVERKGRTREELHQVIAWLTGFNEGRVKELVEEEVTFETFFKKAQLNRNAHLITGVMCGYRIEEIENPLTRQVRYLDKLVDELAKGKKMEKILRKA